MSITTTEAKRQLLQSQPGKKHHYHNDSAQMIDCYFAAYMATNHPEIRTDAEIEGYAQAHAATIKGA